MAEKTYLLMNRGQFTGMLAAEAGLETELFGTNGDNGRLVEVTVDGGRANNINVDIIFKTSAGINPVRLPAGEPANTLPVDALTAGSGLVFSRANPGDNLGQRPPGPPANPGKPARGIRAIVLTHAEVTVETAKAEWQEDENL